MTLRLRLVLIMLGLLVLGLGTSIGATFGALQDWKGDRNDDVLSTAGRALGEDLLAAGDTPLRITAADRHDDVTRLWRGAAQQGVAPSFFQLRGADGLVRQTVAYGDRPALPARLPDEHRPAAASEKNPDGERFHTTRTARHGGRSGGPNWLVRTSRLTDDGDMLLVALQTEASDELTDRTARAAITSSVLVLLALAALSLRAVRRGLRPLEDIAHTAAAIGSGDLGRRVEHTGTRTEVGRLGTALNAMLGQIERAFQERQASEERLRRFVADASHELRTPLTGIRGYAELFRRGADSRPEDLAKTMRRIEAEAERMGTLVDELLLLARLDQGRPLERRPVDLTALAEDAVADASAVEPDRPLSLEAPEPVTVCGDEARLRQVLGNLLANVRRHTPAGTPAAVRVRSVDCTALVEIADRGPGLNEEHRERVFERFFRADPGRSRDQGGAGLGLSIVSAVAQSHGGTVGVRATPGGGATFWLRLPAEPARGGGECASADCRCDLESKDTEGLELCGKRASCTNGSRPGSGRSTRSWTGGSAPDS
ncbi:HAMP domain-containing histidine kinase [Streptomyces sp. OF3]|uniref:histidine kinase n=1 Tax=Streptomyces alkaliterrae TaxID=2213162 RepID=A0A7W3ZLZ1_9ACTN|nr:HAMP domain-containing sensor histidine kinase [Streptomyces alkaliterrae]MBB1253374.1 HAMP domain-containing histidine kinase [Streptomyces alkaliterrae]